MRFVVTQEFLGRKRFWAVWDTEDKKIVSHPLHPRKRDAENEAKKLNDRP